MPHALPRSTPCPGTPHDGTPGTKTRPTPAGAAGARCRPSCAPKPTSRPRRTTRCRSGPTRPRTGARNTTWPPAGIQLRELAAPGAPGPDNPCALRLKLPGAEAAARPAGPGTTHDDRASILAPYLFTPRGDGGWNVTVHHTSRLAGTVADTGTRVELRRADHWSTRLAVVEHASEQQLIEAPMLGRTLGLAKLVFDARWPAGPPIVRLPDEYRKPKKAAPAHERAAAAGGTRRR